MMTNIDQASIKQRFFRGFRAGAPLWIAAAPFAIAYVVIAQEAGLDKLQIQLMSLSVYNATTQIIISQFLIDDTAMLTLFITVIVLNLHHILYGLSLVRHIPMMLWQKSAAAFPLTDFAYGMTAINPENMNLPFLLGIEISVFLAWNIYTALALLFEPLLQNLAGLHVDFIVPLSFFLLLVSSIKTRIDLAVVVFSGLLAGTCYLLGINNVTILIVGIVGPFIGVALSAIQSTDIKESL